MTEYTFPYLVNICYVINEKGDVLLQEKARGFGAGNWNGPGGKIEAGESIEDSVKREVREETGLIIKTLEKIAEIEFVFPHQLENNNYCHAFISREYTGIPTDLGEGKLRWFPIDRLPFEKMWDDDKYWLKEALNKNYIHRRFYFDENNKVNKYINL